ncbi:MAG: response regulator [Erythrobacter sp.]|nr:response regulator [Erythrobacter sp.]
MTKPCTILLLEDEPLILMDLEFAAEDRGCAVLSTTTCEAALDLLATCSQDIDVAVLDVSLGKGRTCFPVAQELERLRIPFILHSGDLDRHDEKIRELRAQLVAKPAAADRVISSAVIASTN